jgi:hypothetical protein
MKKLIIKLNGSPTIQSSIEGVKLNKLSASISAEYFIKLLQFADNKVNPREAKLNKITKSIQETLEYSPEVFFFKSKGILISTENCRILERNRIEMTFDNEEYEGIMDGGHNTLAIASFLVEKLFDDKKLKTWEECKSFWKENFDEILDKFRNSEEEFAFSIPVEIIYPSDEEGAVNDYFDHLKDICSARNNNVQLTEGAKGNQRGFYDHLKLVLGEDFDVIWKPGEPGKIRLEDVVSLATIPLLYLVNKRLLPDSVKPINKISIYSQKGKCVDFFNDLMALDEISTSDKGRHTLKSELVKSALELTKEILPFFDKLFLNFPKMYNSTGGAFGKIRSVSDKPTVVPFLTTDKKSGSQYPHGFLYPLVYGLTSLIEHDEEEGRLKWRMNPQNIDLEILDINQYVNIIRLVNFDPQKVGKTEAFYLQAEEIFNRI